MSRATQGGHRGAEDAARDRRHPPPALREAELPVREWRGAPRAGDPHLLRAEQGTLGEPARRADRAGHDRDGSLPQGAPEARDRGERRAGEAGGSAESPLSRGDDAAFCASEARFFDLATFLGGRDAAGLTHEELEARLEADGRALLRQLFQDHLDLRARCERRVEDVVDARGVAHRASEADHRRGLKTIFGEVSVTRLAYRAKDQENLHLQDAALNLPRERHSHGLRERCAIEATRGSYDEAQAALERATGVVLGKRQVEELAQRAGADVETFYEQTDRAAAADTDALVISCDGKGIVMRPEALREQTKRTAASAEHKLETRLSKGEKKDRKRMAELAVVYDCPPVPRCAADILGAEHSERPEAPKAHAKWLTASVVDDAREVIAQAFDEAERRDPGHTRPFVALVDGNNHQIDRIQAEAKKRSIDITVVVDFVHVLEYLWGAAWCFFGEGEAAAEAWVADKGLAVLEGKAGIVAGAMRRKATALGLDAAERKKADECARYLKNKAPYLDYPKALANGWPIATGVIEGAVRHLVKDRLDLTGARWSLHGAEAMLKLRAVRTNGDWPDYWRHHLAEEHRRVHESRYADGVIPMAA